MPGVVADVDAVARDREAALDLSTQLRDPAHLPGAASQRPHPAVPVADVDGGADDDRRGLGRADLFRPHPASVPDCERDHRSRQRCARLSVARRGVQERLIDHVAIEGGRGGDAAVRRVLPCALAVLRADREHRACVVREEQPSIPDHGRKLDEALRAKRPDALERRCKRAAAREPLPLGVVAVGRPRDPRLGWRRRRGLGRHELDRGGAFDVARLLLDVQVPRDTAAGDREDCNGRDDQDPLPHFRTTA